MRNRIKFAAAAIAASLLTGCGEEDFTGAYRLQAPANVVVVLSIEGDKAAVFMEKGKGPRVEEVGQFKVSVSDKKLMLDDLSSNDRWVMRRNVDERSLDCLNCEELLFKGAVNWKYDPHGPYNVAKLLEEQARKDEEAAEIQARKEKEEAARISTYSGARDRVVNECIQKGVSRRMCECVPRRLKNNGVSEADFTKFTNPRFKPANQAETVQQSAFGQAYRKAISQCMAPGS